MPNLNLPILEILSTRKSILIAGMGGGFDIFCGLPLYYELRQLGKTVHLANYSFSLLTGIDDGVHLSESVVGVRADHKSWYQYFPELYLLSGFAKSIAKKAPSGAFRKQACVLCWIVTRNW